MTLEDIQSLPTQGIQDFHIMLMMRSWYVSATHQSDGLKVEVKANSESLPEALASVAAKLQRLSDRGVIGPANQIEHRASPDDIPF